MKPHQQSAAPIHVLFALLPDSLALDWAGPAEALRLANQALLAQGQSARFVLRFVGPEPETISSVGLKLSGLEPLPATLPEPAWLVPVGQPGVRCRCSLRPPRRCCTGCAACTSPRHLTRRFMAHANNAPLQYLRRICLAMAQTALLSGRNVTQAAALAGFSSDTQLHRAWHY